MGSAQTGPAPFPEGSTSRVSTKAGQLPLPTVRCGARGLRSTWVHGSELAQILDMKRCMQMARLPDSTRVNLDNQGFCGLDDEMKSRYALPLRFTPAVATILVVVGLVLPRECVVSVP